MIKLFLTLSLALAATTAAAAQKTVSAVDQATIYLNAGENNAQGLSSKIPDAQYYACKDAQVLLLIIKVLGVPAINQAAAEINPWTLRNLSSTATDVEALVEICRDQIAPDEVAQAKKLAENIGFTMSLESVGGVKQ